MKIYLQLLLVALIPIGLSVLIYFAKKLKLGESVANSSFSKSVKEGELSKRISESRFVRFVRKTRISKIINKNSEQVVIGLLFGGVAILGTVFGVNIDGATANARDAAPLCAGLFFGSTAGIISGVIGGVYRFVATYWGAGEYSQIACTVSTIVAGLFGAALRKYMFDDKRPTWPFALATAVVMEVFHMTVLFITHLDNPEKSFEIVKICTAPMIVCNAFAVTVSCLLIGIFSRSGRDKKLKYKNITQQVQRWLLIVVVVAYLATTGFVYVLQTGTVVKEAENTIEIALSDVKNQINDGEGNVEKIAVNRHVGVSGYVIVADADKKIVSVTEGHEELLGKSVTEVGFNEIEKYDNATSFETTVSGEECFCMSDNSQNFLVIAVLTHDEVFSSRESSVYINSYMEVLVFALLFFIIYDLIKRKVVNNIRSVNKSLAKIIDGDLSVSVDVKSSEEFCSLSNDINTTVHTLKHYIDEASARIDRELAFAKNIQHSALPSVFPAYPNVKEFDIFATMFTAKEVGGDFYDFYIYDNRLIFLVADVSGKGIPAAMFMMRAKTLLKSLAESGMNISEVFTQANQKLCDGNDAGMFVTAWMGALDIKTGEVEFVNAGHNPPMIYKKGEGYSKLKCRAGFILAGMEGVKYKSQTIKLEKGDGIYLYTDGVTEATAKNGQLFGEERLLSYLNESSGKEISDLVYGTKEAVDEFVGDVEQFDDITMLMLRYNGSDDINNNEGKNMEKTFIADKKYFNEVNDFVESFLDENGASMKAKTTLLIAVEEIFVNIASYAYKPNDGDLTVKMNMKGDRVVIEFEDCGVQFNPLQKPDPDITLSVEDRNIGGLGIFMVKKTMDDMYYENVDGKNILTIEKNIK